MATFDISLYGGDSCEVILHPCRVDRTFKKITGPIEHASSTMMMVALRLPLEAPPNPLTERRGQLGHGVVNKTRGCGGGLLPKYSDTTRKSRPARPRARIGRAPGPRDNHRRGSHRARPSIE